MSVCGNCGLVLRPGDGAVRAFGRTFCDEDCVDSYEDDMLGDAEAEKGIDDA